jgi:hypothetical protein
MEMHYSRPLMPLLKPNWSPKRKHTSRVSDANNFPVNDPRNNHEVRAKVPVGPVGKESSLQVLSNHTRLQNAIARTIPACLPERQINEDLVTQRSIERQLLHLPSELKANIIEFMSEMTSSVKRLETVIESQKMLLKETTSAHERKCKELVASERNCEVYRGRIADVEDKYSTLADVMESKDKHSSKTQMAISRLNKANLTLTQALNSIQSSKAHETIFKSSHVKSRNDDKILEVEPTDVDSIWLTHGKDGGELFDGASEVEISPSSPSSLCVGKFSTGPKKMESSPCMTMSSAVEANIDSRHSNMRGRKSSLMKGEDMRNAMLKLTREKYRFTKKVEILGNEVDDLLAKLKLSDLKCRHLQINLAEYTGTDSSNDFFNGVAAAQAVQTKTKDFGPQDDLFRVRNSHRMY